MYLLDYFELGKLENSEGAESEKFQVWNFEYISFPGAENFTCTSAEFHFSKN